MSHHVSSTTRRPLAPPATDSNRVAPLPPVQASPAATLLPIAHTPAPQNPAVLALPPPIPAKPTYLPAHNQPKPPRPAKFAFREPRRIISEVYGDLADVGEIKSGPGDKTLTPEDLALATQHKNSTLFGEIKPEGVETLLDDKHMNASSAVQLVDLGSGYGRLCMQVWMEYPDIREVTGVEFCRSRSDIAFAAMRALYDRISAKDKRVELVDERVPGTSKTKQLTLQYMDRRLTLRCGDMFEAGEVASADILIVDVFITLERRDAFDRLVHACKSGTRLATYYGKDSDITLSDGWRARAERAKIKTSWDIGTFSLFDRQ